MTAPRVFAPLKSRPKPRALAAFDCEGTGAPGAFVVGAVVSDRGLYQFTNPQEMLGYLTCSELRGYWLFAHNLEYDLGVLTSGDLRAFSLLFAQSRLLWAETQDTSGHAWKFLDSANLFPGTTVADLGVLVGRHKLDLHPVLKDHLKRGAPLSDLDPLDQTRVKDYNLRDAEILYLALAALQEELLSLGGQLQATIAGSSMDLFRRAYLAAPWPTLHPTLNDLARQAYYGARVEPYRLGHVERINAYDVSSLYPAIQAGSLFPHPAFLVVRGQDQASHTDLSREGVSRVTMLVKDTPTPPLPSRVCGSLYFPTGQITGWYTHNELRHALENGADLLKVHMSIFSTRTFNPFAEFIQDMYRRKLLYSSSNDMRRQTFKLILNSAYGRYGIDTHRPLTVVEPLLPPVDWDRYAGTELRLINGWPYALMPAPSRSHPAYANTMIAAYITAGARVHMHKAISEVSDRLVYTDTDSLWLEGQIPTGEGLGEMRQIYADKDLWVVAPKEYAVYSGESLVLAHVKGVPEQYREYYLTFGEAAFKSPARVRESLQRGWLPATWVHRLKKARYQLPKRAPDPQWGFQAGHWKTRPWSWGELQRFQAERHAPHPLAEADHVRLLTELRGLYALHTGLARETGL